MSMKQAKVVPLVEQMESVIQTAEVDAISDKGFVIRDADATKEAQVTFSCLVQPLPGDRVLYIRHESGAYYILGIIARPGSQHMTISLPSDASFRAENGSLQMLSSQSITVAAADNFNCISDRAIHKSREAVVDFDELTAMGTSCQVSYKTIRLISRMVNTMVRQVIEKVKSYIRHTEDSDQVSAGQMTRKVDGLYAMDSRHTVMVSKKDTKIDGERIHMG